MIHFNEPPFTGKEFEYMRQAVAQAHICGDGSFTRKCHRWLEDRMQSPKALLTTSCTHALEMAALLLELQPGDEVIMPSYTFASTADAFVMRGAKPVFVDIRPDTASRDTGGMPAQCPYVLYQDKGSCPAQPADFLSEGA